MKELLLENWFNMLITIAFISVVFFLIVTKQWTKLKAGAYELMLQAEMYYAEDEGKKKFDDVFNYLYNNLIPPWLRKILTPKYIREKLQQWYNLAKKNVLK